MARHWIAVTFLAVVGGAALAQPQYEVYQISGESQYYPTGVNDSGFVVGRGSTAGFTWTQGGGFQAIGRFNNFDTQFYGVNNARTVACAYFTPQGSRGAVWTEANGYRNLLGGAGTYGAAINENGVVGGSAASGGKEVMAKWNTPNTITLLGGLTGSTYAFGWGINDLGDVVGEGDSGTTRSRALLWTAETGLVNLGVLTGDDSSAAFDVNNKREVVGMSSSNRFRGFIWSPSGGLQEVGPPAGFTNSGLTAINESSVAVGETSMGSLTRALLWSPSFGSLDMNTLLVPGTSGWELEYGTDINGNGDVVGRGRYNGVPCSFYARVVPEPSLALLLPALALGLRRWRGGRTSR